MIKTDPQAQLPVGWKFDWETIPSSDHQAQLFLSEYRKEPWEKPRALFVLHGMGEHSGRYADFAPPLAECVDAIFVPDHRGHGRSEGLRGDIARFDLLIEDAALAFQRLQEKLKKRFGDESEIHLLGHSLGGMLALRFLERFPELPIASATISSPLLDVAMPIPAVKRAASSLLKHVWGSLQIPTGLPPEGLSRIPEEVELYTSDRLNHDRMTPRFFDGMMAAMKGMRASPLARDVAIQFLIPLADRVVSADAAVAYYHGLSQSDKRLKTYPEGFHESMNDLHREEFFRDVADWIRIHGKGRKE